MPTTSDTFLPTISADDVVVGEGDGFAELVVRLSAPSQQLVQVSYDTVTGSAGSQDFVNIGSHTLSFASGDTQDPSLGPLGARSTRRSSSTTS